MWLIVGLGNPGPKYETTRHNFGFLALDALIDKQQAHLQKFLHGLMGKTSIMSEPAILLKPSTFMNRSGQAVLSALTFYKIKRENLIVLHDDIDLPLGEMRLKKDGGHGGHNGLRDIIRLLGPDFIRVRLGIGRPAHKGAEADFVLQNFTDQELILVEQVIDKAMLAIETIVEKNFLAAQNFCQIKIK